MTRTVYVHVYTRRERGQPRMRTVQPTPMGDSAQVPTLSAFGFVVRRPRE